MRLGLFRSFLEPSLVPSRPARPAWTAFASTPPSLRGALIGQPELAISLYMLMGEQHVIVPEGVEVDVSGGVLMGERCVDVVSLGRAPGVPASTSESSG